MNFFIYLFILNSYQKIIHPSHTQIVLENFKLKKKEPLNFNNEEENYNGSDTESFESSVSSISSFKSCKETEEDDGIEPRISMSKDC